MDWKNAKQEYESGRTTYSRLAELLGVSPTTVRRRAEKEGWRKRGSGGKTEIAGKNGKCGGVQKCESGAEQDEKVAEEVESGAEQDEEVAEESENGDTETKQCVLCEMTEQMFSQMPKRELIVRVADKLLYSVARAADELDRYVMKNKVKTKKVEYDDSSGKAEKEVISENEHIEEALGIVDRVELRQLVTALKDIKEIYEVGTENGGKIEELIRGLCYDDKNIQ